ncbi:MAG: hypothetical protein ABR498_00515 [Candidatus Dormibacteria bacterium]
MDVSVEVGPQRGTTVASVIECPGWTRIGRDETTAMERLDAVRARYAAVVDGLVMLPRSRTARVVERIAGTSTTDFGAPAMLTSADLLPLQRHERERLAELLDRAWHTFDAAFSAVPPRERARKPKSGRAPDAMRWHLLETDAMHVAGLGRAFCKPDRAALEHSEESTRAQLRDALDAVPTRTRFEPVSRFGFAWTPPFVVRRAVWHALDHAWELEDRAAR